MVNRDIFTGKLLVDNKEKLDFGKYKGRTISSLMITDPKYLIWLVTESENKYNISDTWRQYLEEYSYAESQKRYCTYMK